MPPFTRELQQTTHIRERAEFARELSSLDHTCQTKFLHNAACDKPEGFLFPGIKPTHNRLKATCVGRRVKGLVDRRPVVAGRFVGGWRGGLSSSLLCILGWLNFSPTPPLAPPLHPSTCATPPPLHLRHPDFHFPLHHSPHSNMPRDSELACLLRSLIKRSPPPPPLPHPRYLLYLIPINNIYRTRTTDKKKDVQAQGGYSARGGFGESL